MCILLITISLLLCLVYFLNWGVNTTNRYFGIKEVHRIEGAVPSLGSDMMLYNANNGELLALVDCDWITTMRTGAVAAVSAKALRKSDAYIYGMVGLGNTARATMLCVLEAESEKHFHVKLLRYKNQAELFVDRFRDYDNVSFEILDDINEVARTVDVFISCITSANGLLVADESTFQSGVTVIPVHMMGLQNCDTTFDRVFGDDTDHVKCFKFFHSIKIITRLVRYLQGVIQGEGLMSRDLLTTTMALHSMMWFMLRRYSRCLHTIRMFQILNSKGD